MVMPTAGSLPDIGPMHQEGGCIRRASKDMVYQQRHSTHPSLQTATNTTNCQEMGKTLFPADK